LCLCGCDLVSPTPPLAKQFTSEDPQQRVEAILRAAEANRPEAYPYLITALSDPQPAVRFYAAVALEEMTGLTMGYHYYDPWSKRQEAIGRWREWLEKRNRGETGSPESEKDL
jgi:hypothetical protein